MIPRHLVLGVAVMFVLVVTMVFYARHMRRKAGEFETPAMAKLPVAPPPSGPTERVTLYVADDAAGVLRAQLAEIPLPSGRQQRGEELLRALLRAYQQKGSAHPMPPSADIRSTYLMEPGTAVIDVNAAFADEHRSGILSEQLTVDSFVETLAINVQGISRVRILVDGKARDTLAGHADLSDSFDVETVGRALGGQ